MPSVVGEAAQIEIARCIAEGGKLVARVGETEGRAAVWRLRRRIARTHPVPYDDRTRKRLKVLSGFFPTSDEAIDRLADLQLSSIARIDLYAAWTPHDRLLGRGKSSRCRLIDLEPFFTDARWTMSLAGRRVTVVSPFRESILGQWAKRDRLFARPVLPQMNLTVVQAPQTQCEVDVTGQDWFRNLECLDEYIKGSAPEVVIIGAGAYGLPLGAMAARRGATAVVMGGATQLLFGIMGCRWLQNASYRRLMNDAWVRPGGAERPEGYEKFETAGGAYW